MNKSDGKYLMGDGNIVTPVRQLIDAGYNMDDIKYVFKELIKQDLLKEDK